MLGGFRITVGARAIQDNEWRLRKAASLVKMLTLAQGHRLHREQVMDRLWPHLDPRASSNNLHHALHYARRTLEPTGRTGGASRLLLRQEHLVLCPEGRLWIDVEAFEEAAAAARRARAPAAYRAAMDLYAGELLPEDRYEEWAEDRRQGLRTTYLALLVELSGLHEERGEFGPAIEALRRAVEEEPTGEEAHVGLMRLYALSGRRSEALGQYERLAEALARELAAEPDPASRRLYEEIKAGRASTAQPSAAGHSPEELASAGKHNLPAARSSFVGRERELVEVKRELAMTRLLTLTGAGGSGKTRLALEVGRDLVGIYPDGVWLAELAGLSEGELVAQEVAAAIGVSERPDRSLTDAIVETVGRKKMLLVLDNCEHLIDAAARLADALLDACPGLWVLATSREALGVVGEANWPVPTLSLPDSSRQVTVEELERHESTRLFAERARCRNPTFVVTSQNADAVAEVCWQLDGIPLGIELAAARIGSLTVEQISKKLDDSLGLLTNGSRTATPRQRTLRGALDWSYELLGEPEQTLFRRLSVFAGGFTLETAEAVGAGDGVGAADVLDLLSRLVEKSLVVGSQEEGVTRYRVLEPLRQYAWARLQESGEAGDLRRVHAKHYLRMVEAAEPELTGPQQRLWVEKLEREHDNLRAALTWTFEREEPELGLRLSSVFWRFWIARGYLSEGLKWLEQALAQGGSTPAPVRVKALEGLGWVTQHRGDTERAKAAYGEMLELSKELGSNENIATALNSLGMLAVTEGDNVRARVLLEENLAVLWELEDEQNATTTLKRFHVLGLLGILAINEEGNYARAVELWEEALALTREVGDTVLVGQMLSNLGYAVLLQGDWERAAALIEEALDECCEDLRPTAP